MPPSAANAAVPLVISFFGLVILTVLGWTAATQDVGLREWSLIGIFAVPIVGLFLYAVNVASRRGTVVLDGDGLTVTQAGLFFRKRGHWRKEEIQRIDAMPSGMRVNGQAVLELAVFSHGDRRFGAFAHQDPDELCWLAERVSRALALPSAAGAAEGENPNAAGYFVLTRFRTWRPGELIHLACHGAPLAAVLGGGFIFAFMGAVVGFFVGSEASRFVRPWHASGAAALLAGTFGMVFVSGALPKRRIICDWRSQMLTLGEGGDERAHSIKEIESLVLSQLTMGRIEDEERVETYSAQLTARLGGMDVYLLATDHWEDDRATPMNELRPLAARWAKALDVPLQSGTVQPFRHDWRSVWRHAWPGPKWGLVVEIVGLVALAVWRALAL